ncbi:MAG TPA: hypothetical protein VGI85_01755 [Chthoniobacterales bacterium]
MAATDRVVAGGADPGRAEPGKGGNHPPFAAVLGATGNTAPGYNCQWPIS